MESGTEFTLVAQGRISALTEQRFGSFSEFLRHHRQRLGLTQHDLAEASKISQSYVSGLERGINKEPEPDKLEAIATGLQMPPEEVFHAAGKVYRGRPLPAGTETRTLPSGRQVYITTPTGEPMGLTPDDLGDIDLVLEILEKRKQRP